MFLVKFMKKHIVFDCDGTLVNTSQLKYSLFDGIKELLLALSGDAILYVWTARDRKSTQRILKEFGILQYFHSLSTIDDALPKPHVSGLVDLVGEASNQSVCVIGDTTNDILGAKNFGAKSIGVVWNKSGAADVLKHSGADFIAQEPHECLDWINKNL